MTTEILIALLAGDTVIAGGLSSVVTWLLSRRKYNTEVDQNNIENMLKSLEFYKAISNDYKVRLEDEIKSHNAEVAEIKRESAEQIAELKRESAELRQENLELKREMREQEKKFDSMLTAQQREITLMKNQMLSVYSQVCLNFNCKERVAAKKLPISKPKSSKKIKTENINETV